LVIDVLRIWPHLTQKISVLMMLPFRPSPKKNTRKRLRHVTCKDLTPGQHVICWTLALGNCFKACRECSGMINMNGFRGRTATLLNFPQQAPVGSTKTCYNRFTYAY
jgi:hypothetical protein